MTESLYDQVPELGWDEQQIQADLKQRLERLRHDESLMRRSADIFEGQSEGASQTTPAKQFWTHKRESSELKTVSDSVETLSAVSSPDYQSWDIDDNYPSNMSASDEKYSEKSEAVDISLSTLLKDMQSLKHRLQRGDAELESLKRYSSFLEHRIEDLELDIQNKTMVPKRKAPGVGRNPKKETELLVADATKTELFLREVARALLPENSAQSRASNGLPKQSQKRSIKTTLNSIQGTSDMTLDGVPKTRSHFLSKDRRKLRCKYSKDLQPRSATDSDRMNVELRNLISALDDIGSKFKMIH